MKKKRPARFSVVKAVKRNSRERSARRPRSGSSKTPAPERRAELLATSLPCPDC